MASFGPSLGLSLGRFGSNMGPRGCKQIDNRVRTHLRDPSGTLFGTSPGLFGTSLASFCFSIDSDQETRWTKKVQGGSTNVILAAVLRLYPPLGNN